MVGLINFSLIILFKELKMKCKVINNGYEYNTYTDFFTEVHPEYRGWISAYENKMKSRKKLKEGSIYTFIGKEVHELKSEKDLVVILQDEKDNIYLIGEKGIEYVEYVDFEGIDWDIFKD
jgi:hypothetical protein